MSMKPIHGNGTEPIAKSLSPNLINHPNEHPSGAWGAVAANTVTQPKFAGNEAKPLAPNLVSHPNHEQSGHEMPDHSGGGA